MRSYVLAFCNLEIEHRALLLIGLFFVISLILLYYQWSKLIFEEFYPLASNFVCWLPFLFVFSRPPLTTTEFWLFTCYVIASVIFFS